MEDQRRVSLSTEPIVKNATFAFTYLAKDMLGGYPFLKSAMVFIAGCALCFLICRFFISKLPYAEKIF